MPTDQPAMKSKSEILGDPRPLPNSLGMRLTNVDAVKRPVEGARSTIGNISHRLLSSARRGLSPARNKAERIFVSDGIDAIPNSLAAQPSESADAVGSSNFSSTSSGKKARRSRIRSAHGDSSGPKHVDMDAGRTALHAPGNRSITSASVSTDTEIKGDATSQATTSADNVQAKERTVPRRRGSIVPATGSADATASTTATTAVAAAAAAHGTAGREGQPEVLHEDLEAANDWDEMQEEEEEESEEAQTLWQAAFTFLPVLWSVFTACAAEIIEAGVCQYLAMLLVPLWASLSYALRLATPPPETDLNAPPPPPSMPPISVVIMDATFAFAEVRDPARARTACRSSAFNPQSPHSTHNSCTQSCRRIQFTTSPFYLEWHLRLLFSIFSSKTL